MAGKFVPLDEAARMLNVPADRLVDMIKDGQIRGFRDGASWKFSEQEISRLQEEGLDVLDDMALGGSSILISEQDVGSSVRRSGSVIIGGDKPANEGKGSGSDIELGADAGDPEGSGLMLVADEGEHGSDVRLVSAGKTPGPVPAAYEDDGDSVDDLLQLAPIEDVRNQKGKGSASSIDLGKMSDEDLLASAKAKPAAIDSSDGLELYDDNDLASELPTSAPGGKSRSGHVLSDMDLLSSQHGGSGIIRGDSSASVLSASKLPLMGMDSTPVTDGAIDGSDLAIADDDDLVLGGGGSDLAIAGDSGLNLMSPSDSGLSLEAEPLDLAGSSISALDLAVDADEASGRGSKKGSGSGSGSLVDFRADQEFNLSPSGMGIDADDDSGSQVIEVEDSADAFAPVSDEGVVLDAAGFDDLGDVGAGDMGDADQMDVVDDSMMTGEQTSEEAAGSVMVPAYEVPFGAGSVTMLLCILMLLSIGGMVMTDMVRNMSDHAGMAPEVNSLTESLLKMFGQWQ